LLQGGVPSVVAMRYAVGDEYARELGLEFYRGLLAHDQPKNAAAALTMARQSLRDAKKPRFARFAACDHATPVLYGAEQPGRKSGEIRCQFIILARKDEPTSRQEARERRIAEA